jgi:hypothetical protein
LRTCTDPLPAYWQSGGRALTVKGLPVNVAPGEALVARLHFDGPVTAGDAAGVTEFEG